MLSRRAVAQFLATTALLPAGLASRTAPPLSRIAFGSCADQTRPQPIWDAILAYRPDLFIFAGDNVYGDFKDPDAAPLKLAYALTANIEGYTRLRTSVPHFAIWDDHDYGSNDGGSEFVHKAIAKEIFLEHWKASPDDIRRTREGVYDSHIIGPPGQRVQIVLLDTRWFRSPLKRTDQRGAPGKERYLPDANPNKTMLGTAQWAWLADELRKPADLRLLVSSVQVLVEGHGWERWGNLPLERQKLFDTIREANAKGVIFVTGDRHIGALYHELVPGLYPLYEITSSGINKVFRNAKEAGPNRLGDLLAAENFGTVEIDWPQRRVALALRGMSGAVERSVTIPFADIGLAP